MAKSLLQQVMIKPAKNNINIDLQSIIDKIESGYMVGKVDKYQKKKTFAPSALSYGSGECPRYWYLAFEGGTFQNTDTPYSVANMSNGSLSHGRIQEALLKSGIAKKFVDDNGNETTEVKLVSSDPPIYGFADGIIEWEGEDIVVEIKTMKDESFEFRKKKNTGANYHLIQLLIYMKILKIGKGMLIYENKNTHELLILPVIVNDYYRQWIDNAFNWMREVRQAWENKTIPKKNYRNNSKVCKSCPLQKDCAIAEPGEIKINSLEELSEDM